MRQRPGGTREYAFVDRNVLAPRAADAWVRSTEDDADDVKLNGGAPPEVVCRNEVSLPVRTAWLPESPQNVDDLVVALNRRIVRLGKLRVWLQSPAIAPGTAGWPYRLAITAPGSETFANCVSLVSRC